jgi:glycosyltransferase involved in cell wall biosynthesis
VAESLPGFLPDVGFVNDLEHRSAGLTVVLPCYNEAEGDQIGRAYAAICEALGEIDELEILVVDDGSEDDTLERVRDLAALDSRVKYLSFTRNYGVEAAQHAAFRYASRPWLVQVDADLQFPPEETWRLLAKAAEGYDVVFGVRTDRQDPAVRRLGSAAMHWIARNVLGITLARGASTFRVIRTPVARRIAELGLGAPYTIATVPMLGARYTSIPTSHNARDGKSRWRSARLVGHTFELFFGYSWRPLNAVYLLALLAASAAVLAGGLGLTGVASPTGLMIAALAVTAVTVTSLAILTRYVYRLMLDLRPTRRYYIREANVALLPEDTLDGGEPAAPPPARRGHSRAAPSLERAAR